MTIAELALVGISFVIGYVLGNVYPAWQPEDEIKEHDEDKEIVTGKYPPGYEAKLGR